MLQQTTVAAVIPYFSVFMSRWPSICDLASSSLEDVLGAWAGLGYYARARNLHACARIVCERLCGIFPDEPEALRTLPGVGSYTAAAISAIAYGRQIVPVDSNVERVIARYYAIEADRPVAKRVIEEKAQAFLPCARPGDLAQALMDLGALICMPRRPSCTRCPLRESCVGSAAATAGLLPRKAEKRVRPVRHADVFWLERCDGAVLLRTRPSKGLLGHMQELPSGPWSKGKEFGPVPTEFPAHAAWKLLPGRIHHLFTHFELIIRIWRADVGATVALKPEAIPSRCRFVHKSKFGQEALPSVMKKVIRHVLSCSE